MNKLITALIASLLVMGSAFAESPPAPNKAATATAPVAVAPASAAASTPAPAVKAASATTESTPVKKEKHGRHASKDKKADDAKAVAPAASTPAVSK
ncbi:hypothetical protein ACO0LF_27050 [Undibacterium sp. Di27W]|uniref:hypothetical protein n=1 Tax=Undibacterium sp. Di27W TaxID=3413036 RepID=UPI003BF0849F